MWKILVIIILIALFVGGLIYYKTREREFHFLDLPVLFTAYAHSIDNLTVVPLYQDPQRKIEHKRRTKKIPDEYFQSTVGAGEKLSIVGSVEVYPEPAFTILFYLVKTRSGHFGYIPNYRLAEKDGKPLATPPRRAEIY